MVEIKRVDYGGWPNCYRLSDGRIDLIATTDVGPRIIRFGFSGRENEFKEYAETLGRTGGDEWRIYGGHRLWVAPEDPVLTYEPDNDAVEAEVSDGTIRLTQRGSSGIEKTIVVEITPAGAILRHAIRNMTQGEIVAAPWALSVMAQGGRAIVPLPPRGAHGENLLPTSAIALWPYTDMRDPRWTWGRTHVARRQDPAATAPQKAGFTVPDGWCAYRQGDHVFVKTMGYDSAARYPDLGSNVEVYTDSEMLELETLGPLVRLSRGESAEHIETWSLYDLSREELPPELADIGGPIDEL